MVCGKGGIYGYGRFFRIKKRKLARSFWPHALASSQEQARIDGFAKVTGDHQFIHLDRDAAALTPFGGTIAHGFLTLSLLVPMANDVLEALPGPHGHQLWV